MATWVFEPGHTAAEFCVRHMMVTWVRGHFKDIHGTLEFDPDNPATLSLAVEIAAITNRKFWVGPGARLRDACPLGLDGAARRLDFRIAFQGFAHKFLERGSVCRQGSPIACGCFRRPVLRVIALRLLGQLGQGCGPLSGSSSKARATFGRRRWR